MSIENMKSTTFPSYSIEEWKEAVETTLKGKTAESLITDTYENIILKPLYTQSDQTEKPSSLPGAADYRRGIDHLGYVTSPWRVAQTINYKNLEELKTSLDEAIENGQEAIAFDVKEELFLEKDKFEEILIKVHGKLPFSMDARNLQNNFLKNLTSLAEKEGTKDSITGWVGQDPIAILAETGSLPASISDYYDDWSETIKYSNQHLPNLQTLLVNTSPCHNSGANAVQEIAVAVSVGVAHLQMLQERGIILEDILSKMIFKFSVGSQFFMEISKLRAARVLWNKITEAYGASPENRKMKIAASTSLFTKTVFDPYVNMLRAGNEAFAAVIGGVQYLDVNRFDEASSEFNAFSGRIARNTQHILREEAHLKKVIDPAGGSWYVESLTNELAVKAWDLFLEIDSKGGIVPALKSGWIQSEIKAVTEKRLSDTFNRTRSIIGTNVYANIEEHYDKKVDASSASGCFSTEEAEIIQPLKQQRLSEPYEEIRFTSSRIAQQLGEKPALGILNLGELKKHKARTDYITGVLAVGGISAKSKTVNMIDDALAFVQQSQLKSYFLCGDNSQYDEGAVEIVRKVKAVYPTIKLLIAGLPDPDTQRLFREAGADDFIHVRSNVYHVLSTLLQEMEVGHFEA